MKAQTGTCTGNRIGAVSLSALSTKPPLHSTDSALRSESNLTSSFKKETHLLIEQLLYEANHGPF